MTMLNITTNTTTLLDSQLHLVEEDEGSSLLLSIVTGIACTILIFTAFMPFAQRWDKYITRKCAGNIVYVAQHFGDNASSIFSDVVFSSCSDGDVEDCSKKSISLEIASRPDIERGSECMNACRNNDKREECNEVDDGIWMKEMMSALAKVQTNNQSLSLLIHGEKQSDVDCDQQAKVSIVSNNDISGDLFSSSMSSGIADVCSFDSEDSPPLRRILFEDYGANNDINSDNDTLLMNNSSSMDINSSWGAISANEVSDYSDSSGDSGYIYFDAKCRADWETVVEV